MAIEQATLPRDEMAEAEVRREAQLKSRFLTQTALSWVGIFIVLIIFFSFIKLEPSFLFSVCTKPDCTPYLFSVGPDLADELDKRQVSDELQAQFQEYGKILALPAEVEVKQAGHSWIIADANRKYLVRRQDQTLNVHSILPEGLPRDVILIGTLTIVWSGWLFFILEGIGITLVISVASITLAVVLAFVGALGRLSKNPTFFGPATFYTSLFRGTPLIVQVFFWYLALPQVKIPGICPDGIVLKPELAGIFALAVCYGAYMMETFRAGIQSISKGQTEAAVALGMTQGQTMRRIILPQAVRIVIPPIGNEFIAMTKDSAMVKFMGVWELFFRADKVGRQYFRNFETLLVAALVYWIMTIILQYFQSKIETRMARGDR